MGKLSATICVPFGAETVENDPCTVGTTRNYTAGTGNRQSTSAQAKVRNRQAFQRRVAQKTSRIHVAERETSQVFGAEPKPSGISGAEPRLRVALAALEEMEVLMARATATLHALQFPVQPSRCPLQPSMGPSLADLIANLARDSSSAHSWSEEEEHNDIGARAAHRVGEMVLCDDIRHINVSSEDEARSGLGGSAEPSRGV